MEWIASTVMFWNIKLCCYFLFTTRKTFIFVTRVPWQLQMLHYSNLHAAMMSLMCGVTSVMHLTKTLLIFSRDFPLLIFNKNSSFHFVQGIPCGVSSFTNNAMKYLNSSQFCGINVLVQNCSNSSALAMELLQSCTKTSNTCNSRLIGSRWWLVAYSVPNRYLYQWCLNINQNTFKIIFA